MKSKKQNKRMATAWLAFALVMGDAYPCSTFMLPDSEAKVMGKNFVWGVGHGQLTLNRRNIVKKAYLSNETGLTPHEWKSKYASLSFNQIAENFPMGGINSEGLAVEILLAQTTTPTTTTKPAVNELQWIQLMLDSAANLAEAKALAESVDIVADGDLSVHYHVCDKTGSCGVFEYLEGQLVVSDEETVGHNPVHVGNSIYGDVFPAETGLSTDLQAAPIFDEEELLSLSVVEGESKSAMPSFAKATLEEHGKSSYRDPISESIIMYKILLQLSRAPQWQIVYELANGVIHFRSEVGGPTRVYTVGFKDFPESRQTDCRDAVVTARVGGRFKKFVDRQLSFDLANATAGQLMSSQNSNGAKNPELSSKDDFRVSGPQSYSAPETKGVLPVPGPSSNVYRSPRSGSFVASSDAMKSQTPQGMRLALPTGFSPYVLGSKDFKAKPFKLVDQSRSFLTTQAHMNADVVEDLLSYGSTHTHCSFQDDK